MRWRLAGVGGDRRDASTEPWNRCLIKNGVLGSANDLHAGEGTSTIGRDNRVGPPNRTHREERTRAGEEHEPGNYSGPGQERVGGADGARTRQAMAIRQRPIDGLARWQRHPFP